MDNSISIEALQEEFPSMDTKKRKSLGEIMWNLVRNI